VADLELTVATKVSNLIYQQRFLNSYNQTKTGVLKSVAKDLFFIVSLLLDKLLLHCLSVFYLGTMFCVPVPSPWYDTVHGQVM
jgi:hypothetical protein